MGASFFKSTVTRKTAGVIALSTIAVTGTASLAMAPNSVNAASTAASATTAATDITSQTSNWTMKLNDTTSRWGADASGNQIIGNGYLWNITNTFKIPDGAKGGDIIKITLPSYEVTSPENIDLKASDGTVLGKFTNLTANTYQIILTDAVNNLTNIMGTATYNVAENTDYVNGWKVDAVNKIGVIVDGKTYVDASSSWIRTPVYHNTTWDAAQFDIYGAGFRQSPLFLGTSNESTAPTAASLEAEIGKGPYTVTMTANTGTVYDCGVMETLGVSVLSTSSADAKVTGSDLKNVKNNSIPFTSCTDNTLKLTIPAGLTDSQGNPAAAFSVQGLLLLTQATYDAKSTDALAGGSITIVSADGKTTTESGTVGPYNYSSGALVGDPTLHPPVANPDTQTVKPGQTVAVDVMANDKAGDKGLDPSTLQIAGPTGYTTDPVPAIDANGKTVGTYTVDTTTGKVLFTAGPDYVTSIPDIGYKIADKNGLPTNSTVSITEKPADPVGVNDTKSVKCGESVTLDVLGNDSPSSGATWNVSSLKLLDASGNQVTSLSVTGGTYKVVDGKIVFTASTDCTINSIPSAKYIATDTNGNTVTPVVSVTKEQPAVAPKGANDTKTIKCGQTVPIDVLANDVPSTGATWNTASLKLVDASGSEVTSLVVPGGKYTVSGGKIYLTASQDCSKYAIPAVKYTVTDTNGKKIVETVTVTKMSSTPAPAVTPAPAAVPVTGPKVQTDFVGSAETDKTAVNIAGAAGFIILGGAAIAAREINRKN